jgi:hypothetical protein
MVSERKGKERRWLIASMSAEIEEPQRSPAVLTRTTQTKARKGFGFCMEQASRL